MGKQKRYVSGKDFKDMKQTVDDENDAEAQHEKDLDKKPMSKIKEHLSMKQKMAIYNASDKSMDSPDGSDKRDEIKRKKKWAKHKTKVSWMSEKRDSRGRWTT